MATTLSAMALGMRLSAMDEKEEEGEFTLRQKRALKKRDHRMTPYTSALIFVCY